MSPSLPSSSIANRTSRLKPSAFTLVELLVVIGIIAVLISMILPALNRARMQARSVTCLSNLRQIGVAMAQYRNENRSFEVPLERTFHDSWTVGGGNNGLTNYNPLTGPRDFRWFNYLYPYTKTYKVFNCEMMNERGLAFSTTSFQPGPNTQVKDSKGDGAPDQITPGYSWVGASCNYAYAGYNGSRVEDGTKPSWATTTNAAAFGCKKYSQIKGLAAAVGYSVHDVVAVVDGVYYVLDGSTSAGSGLMDPNRFFHSGTKDQIVGTKKYSGSMNALFFDGHASLVAPRSVSSAKPMFYGYAMPMLFAR